MHTFVFHKVVAFLKDVKMECSCFPCYISLLKILVSAYIPMTRLPQQEEGTQKLRVPTRRRFLCDCMLKAQTQCSQGKCGAAAAWTSSVVWSRPSSLPVCPIYLTGGAMCSSGAVWVHTVQGQLSHILRKDMRILWLTDEHICHLLYRQKDGFLSLLPAYWSCIFENLFPARVFPGVMNAKIRECVTVNVNRRVLGEQRYLTQAYCQYQVNQTVIFPQSWKKTSLQRLWFWILSWRSYSWNNCQAY